MATQNFPLRGHMYFLIWVKSEAKTLLNMCEVLENSLNELCMLRNGFRRLRSCVHS